MNTISITGRITHDLELKTTPSGISVCTFTVAVKRPNVKDVTDFIPFVAWRHSAEFISRYFRKGDMIAIVGTLTTRKYEDNKGNKRTITEVVVDSADFCGKSSTGTPTAAQDEQNANEQANMPPNTYEAQNAEFSNVDDEHLPF